MRVDERKAWLDIAGALHAGLYGHRGGRSLQDLDTVARRVATALDALDGRWGDDLAANFPSSWFGPNTGDRRPDIRHSWQVDLLKTAWRLVTDDVYAIPRSQRENVMAALERGGVSTRRWSARSIPNPLAIGIDRDGLAMVTPLLACGVGRNRAVAVTCEDVVERTQASDAPVVAILGGEREGHVTIRLVGGVFHRPVLEPNSWSPAGLDRFAEAAASGEAWADNPWLPTSDHRVPCASVTDVTCPRSPSDRSLPGQERDFLARAKARAGRLLSVDGVVYRACDPPTVEFALVGGKEGMARLGWHVGNLNQFSDQRTLGPGISSTVWRCRGERPHAGFWPMLSLAEIPVATSLAETVRAELSRRGRGAETADIARPVPVAVHRPDLLPDLFVPNLGRFVAWGERQFTSHLARLGDALAVLRNDGLCRIDAVDVACSEVERIVTAPGWLDDKHGTGAFLVTALEALAMQAHTRDAVAGNWMARA